jgi:transposase
MNTSSHRPASRSEQPRLFEMPAGDSPPSPPTESPALSGRPRLQTANRPQIVFRTAALDELIPPEHPARVVWDYVEGLDLSPLYNTIKAVVGNPGRPPIDPKILMALWLYATLDGVGSARQLNGLCRDHDAYRWILGDVPINYHTLADFRTAHGELLDRLLTQGVAVLVEEGLVELNRVAQDGMRVRASAGAASFRRRPTLEEALAEAQAQVQALRAELEANPGAGNQRRQKARCSTTDADAPVMKMADGGFRPAYNFQFGTATNSPVIVGVEVENTGSDAGQAVPMVEQVQERYETTPGEVLCDGGFAQHDQIATLEAPENGCTVYAPVPAARDPKGDRHAAKPGDSPAVAAWRARMATEAAKTIYKERASTAECVHAQARNRGLIRLRVRGLVKVKAVALWYALAHNLMRAVRLRAAVARVRAAAAGAG